MNSRPSESEEEAEEEAEEEEEEGSDIDAVSEAEDDSADVGWTDLPDSWVLHITRKDGYNTLAVMALSRLDPNRFPLHYQNTKEVELLHLNVFLTAVDQPRDEAPTFVAALAELGVRDFAKFENDLAAANPELFEKHKAQGLSTRELASYLKAPAATKAPAPTQAGGATAAADPGAGGSGLRPPKRARQADTPVAQVEAAGEALRGVVNSMLTGSEMSEDERQQLHAAVAKEVALLAATAAQLAAAPKAQHHDG
jgi:hypothetical protein